MAEEPKAESPWEPVLWVVGILIALTALAWQQGTLKNFSMEGFFTSGPPIQNQINK